ncbi:MULTISPECIES: ATP phosphoribosyltransferase regulatory subunit [Pseudanabaena]|uniref:ATP phosphoribosyltransferase regulatory subunit n=2 Tax=Pseudanabaena TaxID=1152 RepID=L8N3T0_9CYAN|nr:MULTISPECIES: ATP phosphoribosyltransferase regulatory subunit [Pseudanabaena]ELS33370.1 ATP phosphoribosyltransferase regulatory subunit [Pseudanabaena biceps PCC 7429]MDG3494398.1 ATP phosphoribosyltransferase regulatory subunit [Pseudanabaena catenata USMAC16]
MVHQLPTGAKDLLPLDVAQKRWIESRIQQVFQLWGYQRIITPTIEHLRSLTAGGAVDPESVIQLPSNSSDVLGLRPEFTASIARAYAARLGSHVATCPQRIYYNANVFRRRGNNTSEESFQAGVELLGASGLMADGEILMLLAESLDRLELQNWQIILGDARLTTALLDLLPEQYRTKVRQCLANLDRVAIAEMDLPTDVKGYAIELIDLRGKPKDLLSRLSTSAWTSGLTGEINYLKSLIDLWESTGGNSDRLILDLSFMQTFDYYTGIVFEVACDNYVVAQGGRYDHLLGVYHPHNVSYPSIGFCLNLEELQQALQSRLPQTLTNSSYLVVAKEPDAVQAAFAHAAQLRQSSDLEAVELELQFRAVEAVRDQARSRGIPKIAWVSSDGAIVSETLN